MNAPVVAGDVIAEKYRVDRDLGEGQDLAELLRERGQLEIPEALDYVLQACVALAAAHAAGVVHRALRPASLLLATAPDGAKVLKVLDLGAAREPHGEGDGGAPAQAAEALGSPVYMSPELMRSSRAVDARTDIWSLGAILYRLLTGQPPFGAGTITDLALRVASAEPALPSSLRPDIPPAVERTLLCCLDKDPARRPANVAELAIALAPFASASGQDHAERAARILGATLPPRPRGSLPTIGLGLNAKPRPALRLADAGPGAPAASRSASPAAPAVGSRRVHLALAAAVASLLVLLCVVAARSAAPDEPPAGLEKPAADGAAPE